MATTILAGQDYTLLMDHLKLYRCQSITSEMPGWHVSHEAVKASVSKWTAWPFHICFVVFLHDEKWDKSDLKQCLRSTLWSTRPPRKINVHFSYYWCKGWNVRAEVDNGSEKEKYVRSQYNALAGLNSDLELKTKEKEEGSCFLDKYLLMGRNDAWWRMRTSY